MSPFDATVVARVARGRPGARSARPTWTSSRWARPPSTPRTARPTTRGTSTASPAAPAAARPQPSPRFEAPLALGSDTGGSIRQPAHVTGTVGLKPTYGGVSRYGAIALASSLDQVGPVTRTVLDAGLLHDVIGGHDPHDSTSLPDAWPSFAEPRARARAAMCSRACASASSRSSPTPGFQAGRLGSVPRALWPRWRRRAPRSSRSAPRTSSTAIAAYYLILPAEASSNLAKFDSVRFGLRVTPDGGGTVEEVMAATREAGFGDEVKRRIILGTYALSAGYYDAYYGSRAEGAHAHPARLRRRVRAGRRHRDARPRRPRRSGSARRSTTRCRCT